MRVAPGGGLPFLALDLTPGFSNRARRTAVAPTGDSGSVNAAPLPEFGGADAPPRRQPLPGSTPGEEGLQCIGTDDDAYSTQWWDACLRVLWSNPPRGTAEDKERIGKRRSLSFLGPAGHIERMNAWTHLAGAFIFLLFAAIRPGTGLDSRSLSGRLSTYTSAVLAAVFFVSTGFHTLGTVRWLAPIMRMFDHGAIDVALAVACTTDMAVVTLDFDDVPWQTAVDSIGVAVVILCFFLYRRIVLPPEDTEIAWGDCRLGLFRLQHADFEYSALRSSSYLVLSFGFVSMVPAAWRNLSPLASSTLIICNGASLGVLILGLLLDNVLLWPDVLYEDAAKRQTQKPSWALGACHNKSCGCIMTSHAWWHVFSLVSVLVLTVGREVAIAETQFRDEL